MVNSGRNPGATADAIMAGPRGRRLCLELATSLDPALYRAVLRLAWASRSTTASVPPPVSDLKHIAEAVAVLDLSLVDAERIRAALERAVDSAMYWEEPDGEDVLARHAVVRSALRRVAEHVAASPGAVWLTESRKPEQWAIRWHRDGAWPPLPTDPHRTLRQWGRETRTVEQESTRRPDVDGTGRWWSIPLGLVTTVGNLPTALSLVEDGLGWDAATAIPVRGAGRTFEVRSPDDWIGLCRNYPLEVTASRGPDWLRVTGRLGRWVIPDWERVALDWDAVHLTPLGYLGGATRALPVDADTASVIAGWDPGRTVWLADVVTESDGPHQEWRLDRRSGGDVWVPLA